MVENLMRRKIELIYQVPAVQGQGSGSGSRLWEARCQVIFYATWRTSGELSLPLGDPSLDMERGSLEKGNMGSMPTSWVPTASQTTPWAALGVKRGIRRADASEPRAPPCCLVCSRQDRRGEYCQILGDKILDKRPQPHPLNGLNRPPSSSSGELSDSHKQMAIPGISPTQPKQGRVGRTLRNSSLWS